MMDEAPLVGVIVPVRNRYGRTIRFLDQLDHQTYRNFRIYAVDSNSTDGTADWLSIHGARHLSVVHASDDDYWSGAINRGVKVALRERCEYVLTINDDCIPTPELIETLVRSAWEYGWNILGSRINFLDNPAMVWSLGSFNCWGTHQLFQLREHMVAEDEVLLRYESTPIVDVDLMCGNGVLIHRSVFERVGYYDERNCPHYHADSEFIMRALSMGIRAGVCVDAVLYNDTSTYSRDRPILARSDRPWLTDRMPVVGAVSRRMRAVVQLFLTRRSERYLRTIVYVVRRYGPPGVRARTVVAYVGHALYRYIAPKTGAAVLRSMRRVRRLLGIVRAPKLFWLAARSRVSARIRCYLHDMAARRPL